MKYNPELVESIKTAFERRYSEIRYHVRIESDAPESDIQRVVETADRASMVGDVFRRAHTMKRELTIARSGG